ncbi:MAG: hypothetical protein HFH82_16840 [Lachnospiraceae bacterium]|nr:hypothetical protein [Lachnospiraceae bacterium]
MNPKKICFILCTNHERYKKECLYYIAHLSIPKGFCVDILTISDADSMTAGYNAGMQQSDAKYKIYLHQDVFIINKNFLSDLLNVFEDERIGLVGMVGAPKLPEHAVMWYGERVGRIYTSNVVKAGVSIMGGPEMNEVEAVDGLLMATQYDIPWREDLFTGWDFYDVSQSFEFRRKGYRVVVPAMEEPWCIHDDGFLNLSNYYNERKKFLAEYGADMNG